MMNFELIWGVGVRYRSRFILFFAYRYPVIPTPFVEKTIPFTFQPLLKINLLPTQVPGLFNQQKLKSSWTRNSGKAFLGHVLQAGGSGNKYQVSLLEEGQAGSFSWVTMWGGLSLGCLPTPLAVPCAGITGSPLFLLPAPQQWYFAYGLSVS